MKLIGGTFLLYALAILLLQTPTSSLQLNPNYSSPSQGVSEKIITKMASRKLMIISSEHVMTPKGHEASSEQEQHRVTSSEFNVYTVMAKVKEEQNDEKPSSVSCFKNISFPNNTIFLISNAIFLVTAAFWFVYVITLHYRTDECNRFVTAPGIFVSFSLLALSLTGFYAAYLKSDCLFRIHFFIFFLWMFVIVSKVFFVFFLNKETNPRLFPGTKIHEFRFEDYSGWVRRLVIKDEDWYRTRRCLVKDNVCNRFNQNMTASEFYQMNLTPIQSGCCKPPLSCGLNYEKPNVWTVSRYYNNLEDDCKRWDNSADKLCLDCDSCKAVIIVDLHNNIMSLTVNILHMIFSLSIGITGWFSWLKILRETQK